MHPTLFALIVAGRVWSGDAPAARAVVLFDGAVPAAAPRIARVDEVWLSFSPKVQVVAPGSTLLFRDRDDESHTVHAWYRGHTLFNRASVPKGEEQRLTLDAPGVVTLTCDLHPEMRAFVVVSASPRSAVTDFDGRFSLDAAPGTYHAHVWRWDADD